MDHPCLHRPVAAGPVRDGRADLEVRVPFLRSRRREARPTAIPATVLAAALCTVAFTAFLLAAPGCASTPGASASGAVEDPEVEGPETIGAGSYALDVRGMSCPKCISNVDLQLARIAGVRDVRVDMKNGLVRLRVDAGHEVSKAELSRAVGDAGFTLGALRAEATP